MELQVNEKMEGESFKHPKGLMLTILQDCHGNEMKSGMEVMKNEWVTNLENLIEGKLEN